MADAQRQFAKHYKEVRARIEKAAAKPADKPAVQPEPALTAPVEKRKSDFENRAEEIKAWVQQELARWDNVPQVGGTIHINELIRQVAEKYGIPVTLMLQDSRSHKLVHARQELFYRCVMEKGWSYARIGRYFDRDHTTVLHGTRMHARKYDLPLPEGVKR